MNRNFAETVAWTVGDEEAPIILLHDYQLYMTPHLSGSAGPTPPSRSSISPASAGSGASCPAT